MVSREPVTFIAALQLQFSDVSCAYCKVLFTLVSHYCWHLQYLAGKKISKMDRGLGKCKTQIIVLTTAHFKCPSLACLERVKLTPRCILVQIVLRSNTLHTKIWTQKYYICQTLSLITFGLNYFHSPLPG